MYWILHDKRGAPKFVFSEKAFQRLAELLAHARSSDARQFHMNNCCFTAGFRALSASTLSSVDRLGGKKVFKLCQLLSSTCLNANDMTRGDAWKRCICWRTVLLRNEAHSMKAYHATPSVWKSENIQIITTSTAASSLSYCFVAVWRNELTCCSWTFRSMRARRLHAEPRDIGSEMFGDQGDVRNERNCPPLPTPPRPGPLQNAAKSENTTA